MVISPCCSVALSVSRRSAVLVAFSLSLATKRVSRSTAACQQQTGTNMPLCLAATTHNQQDWSHNQQEWLAEQIRQSFAKQRYRPGRLAPSGIHRLCFGDILNGIKSDATLVSTSVHAVQGLEGLPSLLPRRRRKKRRKRRSQSRASQAMKWPLKHGQNGLNGKPTFGILLASFRVEQAKRKGCKLPS